MESTVRLHKENACFNQGQQKSRFDEETAFRVCKLN
jgi:hypothetical protein